MQRLKALSLFLLRRLSFAPFLKTQLYCELPLMLLESHHQLHVFVFEQIEDFFQALGEGHLKKLLLTPVPF